MAIIGFAIVRPDGKIQRTSAVLGTTYEIYDRWIDADLVNRNAYRGQLTVVPIDLTAGLPKPERTEQ